MTARCIACGDRLDQPGPELCAPCEDQADDEYATAATGSDAEMEAMDDWIEGLDLSRTSNAPHPDRAAAATARPGGARWAAAAPDTTEPPPRGVGEADCHGNAAAAHP